MPRVPATHRRFLVVLAVLYGVWWVLCGIAPVYRSDWWIENILVFTGIPFLIVSARWFVFSRTAYFLIFLFLCLHALGSHYTYAEVPVDRWSRALTGRSMEELLGWRRNHFDRIVHFLYGFLLVFPMREAFYHVMVPRRTYWSHLMPLSVIVATSAVYELLEWVAVMVFASELGMAFLGTQGDEWDTHQDIFWAMLGALLCTGVLLGVRFATGRDFQREWGARQVVRGENR